MDTMIYASYDTYMYNSERIYTKSLILRNNTYIFSVYNSR